MTQVRWRDATDVASGRSSVGREGIGVCARRPPLVSIHFLGHDTSGRTWPESGMHEYRSASSVREYEVYTLLKSCRRRQNRRVKGYSFLDAFLHVFQDEKERGSTNEAFSRRFLARRQAGGVFVCVENCT